MKKKMTAAPGRRSVAELLKANQQGIKVDLGGGGNPMEGFVNIDNRDLPEVDIVHDLELFPWPLPDECAFLVLASHLLEHINPHGGDARLAPLINLLLKKKIVTPEEIALTVGEIDPGPIFMRFLDEVWRILKPGGKIMGAFPYAGSTGYWQDPTHCNGINEVTMAYFDPLYAGGHLYRIYHPKPWKIEVNTWNANGNVEFVLIKRAEDPSYLKPIPPVPSPIPYAEERK